MAKEVVITSVPRGIKLGRTGFQVVMRTAGTVDGVLSSLEQLGGYRHVHPQGSGRNPLIYSYRVVRGNTGQLNVLGRTVDAGNDFSNRSNKLAHLLAIDPGELSALRNSSPAAVLAAIDGRLAMAWQGGPEERPSPFALPAPPVQPATCRRWNDVKGDAGWGGLLAQRAMRGQATLVIAPDCSPTWSRRLLDLFQEVLALLPPDGRWKTSFETTVIGNSSSLLRGTYAGSPESAAGYAGLLVVDLSQRAPLPANVAPDELITIAREGPKQSAAGRAPPMPGGFATPAMPTASLDTTAMPTGGLRPAGPLGPTKPPVAWGDDDDAPRSRLGWYILTAVVLAGVVLAGGMVGGYLWLDARETERLTKKIEAYADIEDGKDADDCPTLEEWQRAFRKDPENTPDKQAFDLLLSALRTKPVGAEQIKTPIGRAKLLTAVRDVMTGKDVLANATTLGALPQFPQPDDATRDCVDSFLTELTKERVGQLNGVSLLSSWIDGSTQLILAASQNEPGKKKELLKTAATTLWPEKLNKPPSPDWIDMFANTVQPKELSYTRVLDSLHKALEPLKNGDPGDPKPTVPESAPSREALARKAFDSFKEALKKTYASKHAEELSMGEVILAKDLRHTDHLEFEITLPSCGGWKPFAEPVGKPSHTWHLKGLPGSGEPGQLHWGTIAIDRKNARVTFARTENNAPPDFLYVPIRFTATNPPNQAATEPIVLAKPQTITWLPSSSLDTVVVEGQQTLVANETTRVPTAAFTLSVAEPPLKESSIRLAPRGEPKPDSRVIIDVFFTPPRDDTLRLTDIWLDGLICAIDPASPATLTFVVSGEGDQPRSWIDRAMRLGKLNGLPAAHKPCSLKDWKEIVRTIVDESPYDTLKGPLNKKAGPFVETWLGGKLDSSEDRNYRMAKENIFTKEGRSAWLNNAADYLFKSYPYVAFTTGRTNTAKGYSRPNEPNFPRPPPKEPPENAKPEDRNRHRAHTKAWRDFDDLALPWDKEFQRQSVSGENLRAFLGSDGAFSPDSTEACAAAAVVVLDLHAKLVAHRASEIMKRLSIGTFFRAEVDLRWEFPGEAPIHVRRLTIEPNADLKQLATPTSTATDKTP